LCERRIETGSEREIQKVRESGESRAKEFWWFLFSENELNGLSFNARQSSQMAWRCRGAKQIEDGNNPEPCDENSVYHKKIHQL
jgi:hypothetical protein